MPLTNQFGADRVALRRIFLAARRSVEKRAEYSPSVTCESPALDIPALSLPVPESLVPRLLQRGVDYVSAETISGILCRALLRLKNMFEANYKLRCQRLRSEAAFFHDTTFLANLLSAYSIPYHKATRHWTAYIVEDYIPRLLRARSEYKRRSLNPKGSVQARPAFNHSAIPTLEQFFSKNPFPSRLEKFELASTCKMEYRQIHVWFQNRRSRLRKEGKELKKPERKGVLPEEVEHRVTEIFFPSEQGEEADDDDDDDDTSLGGSPSTLSPSRPSTLLNVPAPAHAYPAPYPPVCAEDPFPLDSRRPPFELPWLRTPAPQSAVPKPSVDLDSLVSLLSKMTLVDHHTEVASTPPFASGCKATTPCAIGFVTPCVRAPHPALVRKSRGVPRSTWCSPMLLSGPHIVASNLFPAPEPQRSSCADAPPPSTLAAADGVPSVRRKRALPRRVPKHPPSSRFALDMHNTERPGPQFTQDARRISSLTSSASSSSGSDVESALPTPELSTSELPPFKEFLSFTSIPDDFSWLADSASLPWDPLGFDVDTKPRSVAVQPSTHVVF
ncbi:A mating type homeodomain transcription factor [Trametes coccinea BRFM310]|uniref:A mating type homeodomain transcription factor n=1 Tax=Trametes coccinea (strain BRFM310) TaxID=1353009 RepID=A0A1Y2IQ65_TRAC3|nr:A mating type homeodomain transcription factor [Trametes coccinea BRFM310]